ncbi:MAG: patatin-like phospholipase family protein, partial [SAR324 cluster bacterium]|nr:patatin-like phospholipase family protein [SAR324 cluster bacterium]
MMAKSENTTGALAQEPPGGAVAIVLTGGGARAAYQVGLLRCLAEMAPDYRFPIVTGVSAGAINAAFLASHQGGLAEATKDLRRLWCSLQVDRVFETGGLEMARNAVRWGMRLISGGVRVA